MAGAPDSSLMPWRRTERARKKQGTAREKRRKRPQRDNIGASIITYTVLGVPDYNYSILQPKNLFLLLRPYSRERRSHRESAFPILILSCSSLAMGTRGTIQVKAHPRSGEGDREREREREREPMKFLETTPVIKTGSTSGFT